jgi:hypothetical protein
MEFIKTAERESKPEIIINLFEEHYFLEFRTEMTTYYLEHLDEMNSYDFNKYFDGQKLKTTNQESRYAKSSDLVRILLRNKYVRKLTFAESVMLSDIVKVDITKDTILTTNMCSILEAPKEVKETPIVDELPDDSDGYAADERYQKQKKKGIVTDDDIHFCDFEADVTGKLHRPYIVCSINGDASRTSTYVGPDCGKNLLNSVKNEDLLYFHNLAYDFNFLAGYGCQKMCKHGTKNLSSRIHYFGKYINFRDSLSLIAGKLSQFPKYFGLKNIKKEKFPYIYYSSVHGFKSTEGTLTKNTIGIISEAGKYEQPIWTEKDYDEFVENTY